MKERAKKLTLIFESIIVIFLILFTSIKNQNIDNLRIVRDCERNEENIFEIENIQYPNDILDVDVKDSHVYLIGEYFNDYFVYYKFENNIIEPQGYIEDPFKTNRTFFFLYQIEIQDDSMYILGVKEYQQNLVSLYIAEFLDNHSINVLAIYGFNATNDYPYTNRYQNLIINDNYAFIGTTWSNNSDNNPVVCQISIIDINNKSKPVEIGNYTTLGVCSDLVVKNDKIFLLIEKQIKYNSTDGSTFYIGENQLIVLDISNKSIPVKIQNLTLSSRPCSIAIYNNYLYLSYYEVNFEIYDIVDIDNIILIKNTNIESRKIVFKDNLTYVLENEKLVIIDTTNIEDFEKIGEEKVRYRGKNGVFHDCVVEGNYVYSVRRRQDYGGFIIFDCTNLKNPKIVYPGIQVNLFRNQIILIIFGYIIAPATIFSIFIIVIRMQIMKNRKKDKQNEDEVKFSH